MLFDTLQYWVFFALVIAVMASLTARPARVFLVLASFAFYAFWDVRFVALLAASTLFNFVVGQLVDRDHPKQRKAALIVAIAGNLGVLSFFKYYNFFAASLATLLHIDPTHWALGIVLPVGVSFFTFEGIAYNVDIYRRTIQARRDLLDFSLFISFFPHLIAGPIIRPHDFFPQVGPRWQLTRADFQWGVFQILKGLIKKCVFSDVLAIHADAFFRHPADTQVTALVGVAAFGLQIYFDFAGYTDIARGCARLLGYRFPPNFERPYMALDISDFWRRWHISLSSWLRDYLYIPLGGNRNGKFSTYRNYIIVMGLGGLWHGASWNFLVWGLYHGSLLALHRLWLDLAPSRARKIFDTRIGSLIAWIGTTALVFIGWIPFRAANWHETVTALTALASLKAWSLTTIPADVWCLSAIALAYCIIDRRRWIESAIEKQLPAAVFVSASGLCLWLMSLFMQRDSAIPFIYFQF